MAPITTRLYRSPANSGGNDGALPTVYDPTWQTFTNLTPAQIFAFQSFPQDLVRYLKARRWMAEISGFTANGIPVATDLASQQKIAGLKQAVDNGAITANTSFFDSAGNIQTLSPSQVTALYEAVVAFVAATYNTAATLQNGVNAATPTVTTRKAIDAAYAAFAPNSQSALNPSPT